MDLQTLAETMYAERKKFIDKYPGRWTLTTDLRLIPENMDFENPNHVFGFDSTRAVNMTVPQMIHLGLKMMSDIIKPTDVTRFSRIRVRQARLLGGFKQRNSKLKSFKTTRKAHDLRCILGRNFLN